MREVVENVQWYETQQMQSDEECKWQGKLSFLDIGRRFQCCFSCLRFLVLAGICTWLFSRIVPRAHPQRKSHNGEVARDEHRTRQVSADTDKPVRLHKQVEEETLMEMFEEVVQTATDALHGAAQGHLVLPAVAGRLQRDRVDMIRHEAAVRPGRIPKALLDHSPEDRLQAHAVAVVVIPHLLQVSPDAHLAAGDGNGSIEEVEIGQLAIHTVVGDMQRLEAVIEWKFKRQCALQGSALQR